MLKICTINSIKLIFPGDEKDRSFYNGTKLLSTLAKHASLLAVVQPSYEIDVFKENVILGNDAIFKCQIPSFVSDLVLLESWVDSENRDIRMNSVLGKIWNDAQKWYHYYYWAILLTSRWNCLKSLSSFIWIGSSVTRCWNININQPVYQQKSAKK